jgi:hypothetical protein
VVDVRLPSDHRRIGLLCAQKRSRLFTRSRDLRLTRSTDYLAITLLDHLGLRPLKWLI